MMMIHIVRKENIKTYDCNLKFKDYLLEKEIINQEWLDNIEQEHKKLLIKPLKMQKSAISICRRNISICL